MPDYKVLRRDRKRRRGEGIALYVRTSLSLTTWTYFGDDRSTELMWACVNGTFIGALYNPPRSTYTFDSLLDYIERCVEELSKDFPSANILLADDFNQLSESAVVESIGFDQLVQQPTRGVNTLDRVFVSRPVYDTIRVVDSVVKSDQKAVVVCSVHAEVNYNKRKETKTYRKITPNQHASFLNSAGALAFDLPQTDIYAAFDYFYSVALSLLNQFYPEKTITVSSRDPDYITPES